MFKASLVNDVIEMCKANELDDVTMHAWWDQASQASRRQLMEFLVSRIYQEQLNKTTCASDNVDYYGDKMDDRGHKLRVTISG